MKVLSLNDHNKENGSKIPLIRLGPIVRWKLFGPMPDGIERLFDCDRVRPKAKIG